MMCCLLLYIIMDMYFGIYIYNYIYMYHIWDVYKFQTTTESCKPYP